MKFEELFDQRSIVAMKLKDYIREWMLLLRHIKPF